MCNLYDLTTNQQAIRALAQVMQDSLGTLEPDLDVFPDCPAPVVRNTPEGRKLARPTWGMPTPRQLLKTRDAPNRGVWIVRGEAGPRPAIRHRFERALRSIDFPKGRSQLNSALCRRSRHFLCRNAASSKQPFATS